VAAGCGGHDGPAADARVDAAPYQVDARPPTDTATVLVPTNDAGTSADAGPAEDPPRGLVVVHSDYRSSAVSLLDRIGNVVVDDCINSGSVKPKLSLALSGDVVTASAPQTSHEIAIIDRTNDALTFLEPASCSVVRQLSVATGFHSNPHDVAPLTGGRAYVTRYEANGKPTPDAADFDEGNDVLIVDVATGKPTGRIDLAAQAIAGAGGAATLPRPDRAIALGDRVYVTLNNLSADFSVAGTGRVVVLDPARDAIAGVIDLPSLKNCGAMQTVGAHALLVSCGGAFADGDKQGDFAGIAWIDVAAAPPTVTVYPSKTAGGRTVSGSTVAAVSPDALFVVTNGDFMGPVPDQLWILHAGGAPATKVYDGKASFVLGDVVLDAAAGRLFVTDASKGQRGVQIFDVSDPANVRRTGQAPSSIAHGLPPRSASWY
jgi:hypothetical protein